MKWLGSLSFYNFVGQTSSAFWQWALTIWIMRTFGPESLGSFTYILSVVSPFILFTNFQLRNRIPSQPKLLEKLPALLNLRVVTIALSLLMSLILIYFNNRSLGLVLILSVLAIKGLESWSEIIYGVLQAEDKLKVVSISMVYKCIGALLLMGLAYLLHWPLWIFFSLLIIVHFFIIYFSEWNFSDNLKIKPNTSWTSPLKTFKEDPFLFSLGLMAWLSALNANWPRYFLEHYWGLAELGIFSSFFALYTALSLILNSWLQAVLGPLGKIQSKTEKLNVLKKLSVEITIFHLLAMIVLIPFKGPILNLMYGSDLGISMGNMTLLILLSLFAGFSTLSSYFLISCGHMGSQWKIMVGSNAVSIIVGLLLIPGNPISGALYSLIAGALIQLVCYTSLSSYLLKKEGLP